MWVDREVDSGQADRQTGRQTNRQTDKQTDTQTDRWIAGRKTGKQTLVGRRVYSRQVTREDHLV